MVPSNRTTEQQRSQQISRLARALEAHMALYGYATFETPIIQAADLFLTRAGDQIINRLFTFERNGQQLALRPEFTAAAAYAYVTQQNGDQPSARWQFGGPVFEDDPHQAAHQQFSIGAELIGAAGAAAEAEIIAMAAHGLSAQGISDWRLVIGHVQLMRLLLGRFSLDGRTERFLLGHLQALKDPALGKAHVLEQLDRLLSVRGEPTGDLGAEVGDSSAEINTQQLLDVLLDATQRGATMGSRTRHDIVRRLLHKRQRASERPQIAAALDFLETWSTLRGDVTSTFAAIERLIAPDDAPAHAILRAWHDVIDLLAAYDIPAERITLQPALARSWDYYTGIVFELHGANGLHLGGGGRYDELARLIGGGDVDVPAVGFAYYADQLLAALPSSTSGAARPVIRLSAVPGAEVGAARWAQALRARGLAVRQADAGADAAMTVDTDQALLINSGRYALDQLDDVIALVEQNA